MLQINQKAPSFALKDDQGVLQNIEDYLGKYIILYFYPKDDTPGCTIEACSFRDAYNDLEQMNVKIFGIGKGNAKAHVNFREKYNLPFTLLVDNNLDTCRKYGVLEEKSRFGKTYDSIKRTTFLINREGNISRIWENVNPLDHAKDILKYLKNEAQ